jgi:hypothetical protein
VSREAFYRHLRTQVTCQISALRQPSQVIASEAKQSRSHKGSLDCFVAEFIIGPAKGRTRWLLAMTTVDVPNLPEGATRRLATLELADYASLIRLRAGSRVPGAVQHELLLRRTGTVPTTVFVTAPALHRTASQEP